MAGNPPPGNEKLLKQLFPAGFVLADIRINLAIGTFKVRVAHQRRAAVTGTGDIDHVQIIL